METGELFAFSALLVSTLRGCSQPGSLSRDCRRGLTFFVSVQCECRFGITVLVLQRNKMSLADDTDQ